MHNPGSKKDGDPVYTLLVLGRHAKPPRKVRLTRRMLLFLLAAGIVVLAIQVFWLFDYVNGKFELVQLRQQRRGLVAQNARLVERGGEKDRQLAFLSDKMRAIELTLEKIEEMEGRVRVLSGDEDLGRPLITRKGPATPRLGNAPGQAQVAQLYSSARDIMERVNGHRSNLRKVVRFFTTRRSEFLQIPSHWPLKGWVTSLFGFRNSPFTGQPAMHNGLDIAAPEGAVIRAPAAGRAVFYGEQGGYGNVLTLQHGRGITTVFGHLSRALVVEGEQVPTGAPIALVGNTGRSTGPHLHFEVRINRVPVNPMRFLPELTEQTTEEVIPTAPAASPPTSWPAQPIPATPADQDLPSLPVPAPENEAPADENPPA